MAAICYILHDLQPGFLVKSVKATLLSDILSDPFTSTEQICLNCKTQTHAVKYLGVLTYTTSLHWKWTMTCHATTAFVQKHSAISCEVQC